ncbi:MAG: gliding motility-associated C-terminal domain-containing protein [Bacteroidetes bacterium]|nr:gliding motility-associated C-terminal domain-containing protein [Bacteroidota bacterium]
MGGIGGLSLGNFYFQNKVFMGGGGGCGDFNNAVGTAGTNGGGIVFIKANNIYGNGYSIKANGNDNLAQTSGIGDGAGGGGAGGIVLFEVNNFLSPLTAEAKGAKGGDLNSAIANCFGPGGGGGSGLVWLVPGTIPGNLTINTSAGLAGKELSPTSPCFNTTNGATDGFNNATLNTLHNLKLQESTVNFNGIVNLGPDSTLCSGDTIFLIGGLNGNSYLWQDGSTTITYTVTQPGQYTLTIVDNTYCSATDTINISVANSFNLNLGNDTTICYGSTFLLDLTSLNANYLWSTGSTNASQAITMNGTYTVTISATGYCTEIDSIKIDTIPGFFLNIGPDTILCKSDSYMLDAGIPGINYIWSTGETTQQISPAQTSIYYLEADNGSCKVTDTAFIERRDLQINLGNDTGICRGNQLLFSAPPLLTYLWQDGTTNNTFALADIGTVWLTASDSVCSETDTVTVTLTEIIDVYLPSVFTPNDDGVNDKFGALSIDIRDYELTIFNRFGGVVFQSKIRECFGMVIPRMGLHLPELMAILYRLYHLAPMIMLPTED